MKPYQQTCTKYCTQSSQLFSEKDYHQLASNAVTLSFLVPTVCRLPPQTIALIALGVIALVVAIFSATVTFIDGIIVVRIRWNAKQIQTLQERCSKNKYEIGKGELCLCYTFEESGS